MSRMLAPLGSPTNMPWLVQSLLVQGVVGPRKWIVHTEYNMDMVLLEVSTDRVRTVLANWSLYLAIPCVHQLSLFLMDPYLVSALMAMVL